MPTSVGSRRSSHAIKQLSVTKDDSFEEEEESEAEEVSIEAKFTLNKIKLFKRFIKFHLVPIDYSIRLIVASNKTF